MNVAALRLYGVGQWKSHSVAQAGKVTQLGCLGNEPHREGRVMASQGFHRYDNDFSERKCSCISVKLIIPSGGYMYTFVHLPIVLSAEHLL